MPSYPEKRRTTTFVLWSAGLVAFVLIVAAVRYMMRERVEVRTAQVSYDPLTKTISTNGKVELVDDFPAYAQAPGVVEDIYVDAGDKVKPGQLLLKMDDADARASLARAEASLEAARLAQSDITHGGSQDERNTFAADLNRGQIQRQQDAAALAALQKLQQQGAASPAEVAAAQEKLQLDDSNLHSVQQHSTQRYGDADRTGAQARLADAQAAVAAAQNALASENIRSPIAGTVYSIPVSAHDYVSAGTDLIYVADLNHVQVTAYFDEPDVGSLVAGQPVKIVWDAKPAMTWHGHIAIAPTSITNYQNTRNVGECEISVDDANGSLQPNANVTVTVTTAQHLHVLSVLREALHTDGAQTYVYRVINKRLVRTPVQVGIVNLTRAEITGGLSEGETVALSATTNRDLSDGLEVAPVE